MLKPTGNRLTARALPGLGPACGTPAVEPAKSRRHKRIPDDLLKRRRAAKRALIDARHEKNAIEHIMRMPEADESVHIVIDGRFHPCDMIPATRRLCHPAIITRLDIATLSYNVDNIATLCRGIDQGKIGSVLLVPSVYFAKVERPLFEYTEKELGSRGSRVQAGYVHAKLILLEMSDGRCFTIEGSGNLRSCKSIEQFSIFNGRDLLEFHRGWLETYLKEKTTYGRRTTAAG